MAKVTFKGLDGYIEALLKLRGDEETTIKKSLFPGAKIIADSIKSEMMGLKTRVPGKYYGNEMAPGPNPQEKNDMIASFGLSPMENKNGFINTKAGFDGYGHHVTDSYPGGVPNALVARVCESGTSWQNKQPFMRKAISRSREQAIAAMAAKFDEEIKKQMS